MAKWIISHFPQHHSYLEPFFGSGAILFTKPRSAIETVNDLDDDGSICSGRFVRTQIGLQTPSTGHHTPEANASGPGQRSIRRQIRSNELWISISG